MPASSSTRPETVPPLTTGAPAPGAGGGGGGAGGVGGRFGAVGGWARGRVVAGGAGEGRTEGVAAADVGGRAPGAPGGPARGAPPRRPGLSGPQGGGTRRP